MKGVVAVSLVAVLSLILLHDASAQARQITISSGDTYAVITPNGSALQGGGMRHWIVGAKDHLHRQWFWLRWGDMDHEVFLDALRLINVYQPSPDQVTLTYQGPDFIVEVFYRISGGPTGRHADIVEQIRITSTRPNGTGAIDFHFFQYSDFNLQGGQTSGGQDTVEHTNNNLFTQYDRGIVMAEVIAIPTPNHWEARYFQTILNSLNDGFPTTLADCCSPAGAPQGVNPAFAWEWDFSLHAGATFLISKDKLISPR